MSVTLKMYSLRVIFVISLNLFVVRTTCRVGVLQNEAKYFTNDWTAQISTRNLAEEIANKEGFEITNEVHGLPGLYYLRNPRHPRKAKYKNEQVTDRLMNYDGVTWADQLAAVARETRNEVRRTTEIDPSLLSCPRSNDPNAASRFENVLNDKYFVGQWYMQDCRKSDSKDIQYDMNVVQAWYDYKYLGKGTIVMIVDDGLETTHKDLKDNYNPNYGLDLQDGDYTPNPVHSPAGTFPHGTRCGGVVAMKANNLFCGAGIAPMATLGAVRLLGPKPSNDAKDAAALLFKMEEVDIVSNSWGPNDDGRTMAYLGEATRAALKRGAEEGRGGLGVIYVWAGGNGKSQGDNCACDSFVSSIYTIAVASCDYKGKITSYSERCSSIMITTYSGDKSTPYNVITTDVGGDKCTTEHSGTSASAPMAAGSIALALEANRKLSRRCVEHLLAWTAEVAPLQYNPGWVRNKAGFYVNKNFGFGLLDVWNLITMARKFKPVPPMSRCTVSIPIKEQPLSVRRISRSSGFEVRITTDACQGLPTEVNYIEHVLLNAEVSYTKRGDLQIMLVSPQGTSAYLLEPREKDASPYGLLGWTFDSVMHWGECPRGQWTVKIFDSTGSMRNEGEVKALELIITGTKATPNHYIGTTPPYANLDIQYY